ncbi:MAG: enoyl-ACP reductase [Deltaproteobacteria bacterium]|nr:enoyl-ACP reductase [Deltaproteobacteria bacterium]MCX7952397.1 enoyl-ACP reductase [Deltaproteobacteria bacterium]
MDFNGKKGIILGIANDKSIAYSIALLLKNSGAQLCLTYPNEAIEKRVRPIAEELKVDFVEKCDVSCEDDIHKLRDAVVARWQKIDFLVHSIAYAEKEDLSRRFIETSKRGFMIALDISAYSLLALCREFEKVFEDGSSILTLTYLGSERVVPNYNVMGVAKAALEAVVKYLAYDLGPKQIRINAISAGPIKTLAASGISGFSEMLKSFEDRALLKRKVTQEEVANAGLFLLSNMSSGITGEIVFVDCGYNLLGF